MNKSANMKLDQSGFPDEIENESSPFEIFHTFWFRRRLLLTVAFFIIAVGLIMLYQKPLRYTADSSILIGVDKARIVDIEAVVSGIQTGNYTAIMGEIQVLKSSELARKVVEKLDLVSLPEFNPSLRPPGMSSYLNPMQYIPESWKPTTEPEPALEEGGATAEEQATDSSKDFVSDAWKLALGATPEAKLVGEELDQQRIGTATGIFRSKLKISEEVSYSGVVNISFESLDPHLAAKVANEIPEMYIIGQLEAKLEATEKATTWLNDQLEDLKIKVEASEQAVQMYREQYDITETKGGGLVIDQLSAINSQLIIARSERAQAEAHLRQIRKLARSQGSGLESAGDILSSATVQGLRQQEADSTRKVSDYSTVYGAKHPKIIQAKAELADIRGRIKREIDKVVEGLKNDVDLARIRESSLEASLSEFKQVSGEQNRETVQLRSLQREAAANRALFETFLNRFKETSSTGGLQNEADARVISKAGVPGTPSYPRKKKAITTIVVGAFGFAALVVFLLQLFNTGVMSPEQVESRMGIPAIGLIPSVKDRVKAHDYVVEKPHSSYCESLNSLRTSLILSGPDDAVKTIQITSSVPGEGKSTLALSFARLLAQSGKKVILVDGDLRRASLEKKLGVEDTRRKGLTDMVMSSGADLAEFVSKDTKSKLLLMPRGEAKYVNASDIFSSHRMETIVAFLRKNFDYVIFDMPPVMAVSDSRIMGRLVDKTVFVVQWDKTPEKVVKTALRQLVTHDVDIAGCVLQQVNLKRYSGFSYGDSGYYYHYGKYGQYYSS